MTLKYDFLVTKLTVFNIFIFYYFRLSAFTKKSFFNHNPHKAVSNTLFKQSSREISLSSCKNDQFFQNCFIATILEINFFFLYSKNMGGGGKLFSNQKLKNIQTKKKS